MIFHLLFFIPHLSLALFISNSLFVYSKEQVFLGNFVLYLSMLVSMHIAFLGLIGLTMAVHCTFWACRPSLHIKSLKLLGTYQQCGSGLLFSI
jgi:hypothetical protein